MLYFGILVCMILGLSGLSVCAVPEHPDFGFIEPALSTAKWQADVIVQHQQTVHARTIAQKTERRLP